jgi:hypothetical protein
VKKLLFVATLAVAGYILYTKYAQNRDERDLWAEVTDTPE